ncbi:MAG: hypothetical protein FWD17_07500 [Polyangiaceae bacterium]|nr:hypothetical protein [Polyangiaceae bacterium]
MQAAPPPWTRVLRRAAELRALTKIMGDRANPERRDERPRATTTPLFYDAMAIRGHRRPRSGGVIGSGAR